jgi:hypothetical protein
VKKTTGVLMMLVCLGVFMPGCSKQDTAPSKSVLPTAKPAVNPGVDYNKFINKTPNTVSSTKKVNKKVAETTKIIEKAKAASK